MKVRCPYCRQPAKLSNGGVVYPMIPSIKKFKFWFCAPCQAWVACHRPNRSLGLTGREPMGTLANARLRHMRKLVHDAFDPLWLSGQMSRGNAYRALAKAMGIMVDQCHVAMFDERLCDLALEACQRMGLAAVPIAKENSRC